MFPTDLEIMQFFTQYAHSPQLVYIFVTIVMFLSSFGLPIPEEITIIALGLIVYMGKHPDQFPPPSGVPHQALNMYTAMIVCLSAIVVSDFLVYFIGRKFGNSPLLHRFFKRFLGEHSLEKARSMVHKYRFWVPAVFRFTPGVRFPGHLSCGMMGISVGTFLIADGLAALLSVPIQIYLFATYGEVILSTIKEVKYYLLIGALIGLGLYLSFKIRQRFLGSKKETNISLE